MAIQFNKIPSNIRLPGVWIETDASRASRSNDPGRLLVIGQMLATGTAAAGVPVPVTSFTDAKVQFGVGSMLADMIAAVRANDLFGLMWAVPLADAGGAVAATGTVTVSAAATAPGVISLYVAGVLVPVAIAGTESINQTATAIAAAINANADLPVTAAAVNAVVTLTANNKGTLGNDIDVRYNWLGTAGGEALPTTYAGAIVAMAGGTTDPTIAAGMAALGDQSFDYICMPYTDAANLNAARDAMNDTTGRWAFNRMVWGHLFTAKRGTVGTLTTLGLGRNDPHTTIRGFNLSPTPVWRWSAAFTAAYAVPSRNDPARPVQGIEVAGVLAPPLGSTGRFSQTERQTLLFSGISTFKASADGIVRIERDISTYQLGTTGQIDEAWLSTEKTYTLMRVHRRLRAALELNFPRAKLAHDGTRSARANGVVTPETARGFVIAEMRNMEDAGLLDNVGLVVDQVRCEIDADNPDRLNILFPPLLIGQLRILAVLSQFHVLN